MIELRTASDWQVLYIDGIKATENHSLRAIDILEALQSKGVISSYVINNNDADPDTDEGYLELEKFFPDKI